MDDIDVLRLVESLRELPARDLAAIAAAGKRRHVLRGELLVEEGGPADILFVVLSGRFSVSMAGRDGPVAEITVGETIGEIGFFAGRPRTASVRAVRDSSVLAFDRSAFDAVVEGSPRIYEMILASLARRLADTSRRLPASASASPVPPRTVTFLRGGETDWPESFAPSLRRVFGRSPRTLILESGSIESFAGAASDPNSLSHALDSAERRHDLVVYIADPDDTAWTRKAIRQADDIVLVVDGQQAQPLNAVERFAFTLHDRSHRRLCILHPQRSGRVAGTADWLKDRDVALHHHVSLEDDQDLASLRRFLMGRALGFVAGGGGGFGPAHLGVYKAFRERGVTFDMFGGSSVGAAMTAGFAMLAEAEALDAGTHAIFVTGRGLRHPTLPRYALLDHRPFDRALREQYGDTWIEDVWRPWFAMTANLSAGTTQVIRSGPVWRAVRASSAIPGVLPPVFTDEGHMLVDAAIFDNLPVATMHGLKNGPNLLVSFGVREVERFEVDYDSIPGRAGLLAGLLNPFARKALPPAPGPVGVLARCLLANARFDRSLLAPRDLLLQPPPFPGSSFLDFSAHTAVFQAACHWARAELDDLERSGDPAFLALMAAAAD